VLDPSRMLSSEDACEAVIKRIEKGKMKIEPFVSRRNPEMTALCEELYQILTTREDGFVFFVKGLVLRFFGYLLKFQLYEKNPLLVPAEEKSEGRMKSVLNYIRKNYGKEISLSELAALSNMSPNYFCRYFRKLTGQTPIEYLITYRLESACYALRNTDLTVTDITFACGFNDVSHFIKSFRKAYGMTPKAYRAQTDEA
jgi:AraC-like DNA-binding protein